jgi:transcriptional regulator with XRE-family HTH domain
MNKKALATHQDRLQALLKSVRIEAGLRQNDLAERLGKPQSFVSKYESGERKLDIVELYFVCKEMGTSLQEFARRFEELVAQV